MTNKTVICAGLFSSASTWTFNVTKRLLETTKNEIAVSIYGDALDEDAEQQLLDARHSSIIIKTHSPEASLRSLASFAGIVTIVTVRHPLDAICSLMDRFRMPFQDALIRIELSANNIARLRSIDRTLVFRFENAFYQSAETVECIAHHLGTRTSHEQRLSIYKEHAPEAVNARIANFRFEGANPASEFDPTTHWHPRHVGDMRSGKWRRNLTESQVHQVLDATSLFRSTYSYESSLKNNSDE